MKFLVIILFFPLLLYAESPKGEFRALHGDHKTIERVIAMIDGPEVAPDKVSTFMTGLVNRSLVKQTIFLEKEMNKEIREFYDKGSRKEKYVTLEMTPSYFAGQKGAFLSLNYSSNLGAESGVTTGRSFSGSAILAGEKWYILGDWDEGKQRHLLVGRFTYPRIKNEKLATSIQQQVKTITRVLEVTHEDLAKLKDAGKETDQRAIKWILKRGKLLDEATISCAPGHPANYAQNGKARSWQVEVDTVADVESNEFDLQMKGSWEGRSGIKYRYAAEHTLKGNEAMLVSASGSHAAGKTQVIMVVSPRASSKVSK